MRKPRPLAVVRNRYLNSVALLDPLRSDQISSGCASLATVDAQAVAAFGSLRSVLVVIYLPSVQFSSSSSFILSSFDLACTCCVPYVEATVFGVGSDDCNDDGCTRPRSAIAMERGEASTVRKCARKIRGGGMLA